MAETAGETVSAKMKVAIAGATGMLGPYIVDALLQSERYQVCILKRRGSGPPTQTSLAVLEVDYESLESLRLALQGQQVLISTLGKGALSLQPILIKAAVAAGVKRIIPSEFGSNLQNPKVREFPTYVPKILIEELLEYYSAHSGVSYTLIYNNTLLDWAISSHGRLLLNPVDRTVTIYDGGDQRFSTATMATVGKAVVGVLDHYEATADRAVYIHDIMITQNELLEIARAATEGDGGQDWTTVAHVSTAELEAKARLAWRNGSTGLDVFYGFAVRAAFSEQHGCLFSHVDNELFGIKLMKTEKLTELVRTVLKNG